MVSQQSASDRLRTIYALIPAAGRSSRMGRPKLLLPMPPLPGTEQETIVIGRVIRALRSAGIVHVLVVAAPDLPDLVLAAKAAGAQAVALPHQTSDMWATVEFGLNWIEQAWSPKPADAWLLVPADHPLMEPEVIAALLHARQERPDKSIFIPTYQSKRGHPTLIGWEHIKAIRAYPADRGLNMYLRDQSEQTLEVPVNSPSILFDLDTPEDYRSLRREIEAGK